MKVSLLAYDLSHNCLSRTYLLAQLLEPKYEIEIVGPKFDGTIWDPVRDEYDYKGITTTSQLNEFVHDVSDLMELVTGDLIYARKPMMNSFGVGLLKSKREGIPILLDMEDYERGFRTKGSRLQTHKVAIGGVRNLQAYYWTRVAEALVPLADGVTVSNRFLQQKFGGTLIRHVRNEEQFHPDRYDQDELRDVFGLPKEEPLIVFAGTPRRYKGVTELVRATGRIEEPCKTVIVGAPDDAFTDELRQLGGDDVIIRGRQPFDDMPKWLAVGDIIAIPQRQSSSSMGQSPAKLFEAMLMGKPIVTTAVSDIPEVIGDTGVVIKPNSVAALQKALLDLLQNPATRTELGKKARDRAVANYSYEAARPVLYELIERTAEEHRAPRVRWL